MLLPDELVIGNLYAWDVTVGEFTKAPYGCSLFTVINIDDINERRKSSDANATGLLRASLTVYSLDGKTAFHCPSDYLRTSRNAFERMDAISQAVKDGFPTDNAALADAEIESLGRFRLAFLKYGMTNALGDPIFHRDDDRNYFPYINQVLDDKSAEKIDATCSMARMDDSMLNDLREMAMREHHDSNHQSSTESDQQDDK